MGIKLVQVEHPILMGIHQFLVEIEGRGSEVSIINDLQPKSFFSFYGGRRWQRRR